MVEGATHIVPLAHMILFADWGVASTNLFAASLQPLALTASMTLSSEAYAESSRSRPP